MNVKKALLYAAGVAGFATLLYAADKRAAELKENPFKLREVTWEGASMYSDVLGGLPERASLDVTGDGKNDHVILYLGGHAFYADGKLTYSSVQILCARIDHDTREAQRLAAARPDFKLAEQKK